jgi:hypothetical protein
MGVNKSTTRLLDILGEFSYNNFPLRNMVYCDTRDEGRERLLEICGRGFFQYYDNGDELQDVFKNWVVKALNEQRKQDKIQQFSENDVELLSRPAFRRVRCCGTCKHWYGKSYTIGDVESFCSLDDLETWESYLCDEFEEDRK